jgi:hypothetical protein
MGGGGGGGVGGRETRGTRIYFGAPALVQYSRICVEELRMSGDSVTLAAASSAGDWAEVLFEEVPAPHFQSLDGICSISFQLGVAIEAEQSQKDRCAWCFREGGRE